MFLKGGCREKVQVVGHILRMQVATMLRNESEKNNVYVG